MHKVLIVEDEEMLSGIIRDALKMKNYEVEMAPDGNKGLEKFHSFNPDIMVLDIMMPEMNGYEVARKVREKSNSIPIIFLSAKSQTVDILKGFEAGANDYVRKPFSMEELVARVDVMLRNTRQVGKLQNFPLGKYVFDFNQQSLCMGERKSIISFKEAQVLKHLAEHINQVVEKKDVLQDVWGIHSEYTSRNMDVVVTRLRQYLKEDTRLSIINIRGIGYKLVVEPAAA